MKNLMSLWIKKEEMKEGIKERVRGALNNEKGQGMVEYGLILALVSVVVIVVLTGIGDNLFAKFTEISDNLGGGEG